MPIGRVTQVVDCREAMGMGKGGGIAQRGAHLLKYQYRMSLWSGMPGRRHVTKPVCDITSGLRQQGMELRHRTLVLSIPEVAYHRTHQKLLVAFSALLFGLTDKEVMQIERHKIAILHHGNVRSHVVHKVRFILAACDVKAVSFPSPRWIMRISQRRECGRPPW